MNNYHSMSLSSCRAYISLYHRYFDILLWVNIGWDMLISISHFSDSVSWWSEDSRKMALFPLWFPLDLLGSCPISPMGKIVPHWISLVCIYTYTSMEVQADLWYKCVEFWDPIITVKYYQNPPPLIHNILP